MHVDLDMQAADAMSYRTLMADLAKLYRGEQLRNCSTATANTVRETARREAGPQPAVDADRDWWGQRIPELPDPPSLPYSTLKGLSRRSIRRSQWFDLRTAMHSSSTHGRTASLPR